MAEKKPVAEQPFSLDDARPLPTWEEARRRLEDADTYWLATVRPDGRPHVIPVLAVGLDGTMHFCATEPSRKARNLACNAHCVLTTGRQALDLVVEGEATKVCDDATLHRVAELYASKYDWHVTVRDGAFYAEGAPTAGPPPFDVYALTPTSIFGFGTDESHGATRWRF